MPAIARHTFAALALGAATVLAACSSDVSSTAPDRPPPVQVPVRPRIVEILFAQTRVTLQEGERALTRATALDSNRLAVVDAVFSYRSGDDRVVRVAIDGTLEAVRTGETVVTVSSAGVSATLPVRVTATVQDAALLGRWRMATLDSMSLPASYARFTERHPETGAVLRVDIQIDSATMELRDGGRYTRRYYFTEWHDGVRYLRYGWGDLGVWQQPRGVLFMESNWIQNLRTDGLVLGARVLRMDEVLWHGEATRRTAWHRAE
ncbi:MAG: hypothetical protein MUE41_17205 [Gemmatimonadaceae bacterium]|jgi:hypothetical protein|nr:hypothetical protein [Gemmatimonadaceae bacterium]